MLSLLLTLLLIGLLLWAAGQLPIDPMMYNLIRVIVIVYAAILVIDAIFGLGFPLPRLGRF